LIGQPSPARLHGRPVGKWERHPETLLTHPENA
jgi:hypothetical protein